MLAISRALIGGYLACTGDARRCARRRMADTIRGDGGQFGASSRMLSPMAVGR
jgi:hypothetical protein